MLPEDDSQQLRAPSEENERGAPQDLHRTKLWSIASMSHGSSPVAIPKLKALCRQAVLIAALTCPRLYAHAAQNFHPWIAFIFKRNWLAERKPHFVAFAPYDARLIGAELFWTQEGVLFGTEKGSGT